jgi:hypothetical protein
MLGGYNDSVVYAKKISKVVSLHFEYSSHNHSALRY